MRTFIEDAALAFAAGGMATTNCVSAARRLAEELCEKIGHIKHFEKRCERCEKVVES